MRAYSSALIWLALAMMMRVASAQRFGDRIQPRQPPAPRAASRPQPEDINYADEYEQDTLAAEPTTKPTKTEAHRLEMSTEFFIIPPQPPTRPSTSSSTTTTTISPRVYSTTLETPKAAPPSGALRPESWAVPVLALACSSMLAVIGFEIYVVWDVKRTESIRRRPLLTRTLLIGLFFCSASAALAALTPSPFTCGMIRFGTGVSYAVVFATLLVECVFLMSVDSGVYLPTAYQALLLFFAVTIQIAIGAQWLGSTPPRVDAGLCATQPRDLMLSLTYCALLVCATCGAALRARGVRDSSRGARRAGGAAGACAAAWLCWGTGALAVPPKHRDACVAGGLLVTAAIVFVAKFARERRTTTSPGVRYDAERDDGLSSYGGAASGYSPSFFHFKPVKYGIVSAGIPDRKEPPSQAADGVWQWPFYPPAHLMHYQNYMPYHYFLPPNSGAASRAEENNAYASSMHTQSSEPPTFSTNPNVFFQRTEGLSGVHPGMMY